MNILSTILDRLNQRIEVGNIFDTIYGLSELVGEGNDKAWAFYMGNGQAIPVTNYDAKQGTLFWAKRGKITVNKNESLKLAGCKSIYETKFSMTAYAMVRKSHLPCDAADAQDWVASRVLRLISGTDPDFKTAIGAIAYEVLPSGYATEAKYLPVNYEWAAVAIDVDINVSTSAEDGCYDTCQTGDIPLPDFEPCVPCLTSVAVDGVTITGNGTPADPLVAVGGGGGGSLTVRDEGTIVSANANTLNFRGGAVQAVLASPGVVNVNVQETTLSDGTGIQVTGSHPNFTITNTAPDQTVVLNDGTGIQVTGTYPNFTITNTAPSSGGTVMDVTATSPLSSTGGTTPDISISQADTASDGYLSSTDWNTFNGKFDAPTGTASDYLDGTGTPTTFPTIPAAQVNSDWNATSGVAEILNKPTIPAAQVNSDWNATSGVAEILNKPTIPSVTGFVPYTGATQDVDLGTFNLTADHIALNVSPSGAGFVVGATQWNNTIGSSETLLKGGNVTLKNGVDLVARIVNKVTPNTTLTKAAYQAVRVSGATGGRLSVSLAQANTDNNSADTIGLVTETIATNQEGFIITVGQLSDINTTGSLQGETWADGDVLYLSPTTAGRLTNIKPTGATGHIVVMGYVEYAHVNQGSIYVKVMNGWELDELHNVYISGLVNNDALIYESSTQLWKNKPITTALGFTPVANTLSISTSSPLSGGGNLTANRTLSIADAAADGATKGAAAFTASDFNASAGVISIDYTNGQAASGSTKGFLTSGDWTTFNGKFNTPSGTTSQYVRGDGTLATFPTIPSGTVTSVGLSMPAAFSVANTPVTASGTLTVTGAGTTGQYVRGDGSLATFPTIPSLTIYKNTTNQTAVTGNTNNNKVVSVLIPANTIAVGNIIEIKARLIKTGGAGITTLRVYTNTADSIVSPAPTLIMTSATSAISQTYNGIDRSAIVKTATNTETVQAAASIQSDAVIGNATLTSSNIDWTQNQYIIFAIQNGSAADSTVLSYYKIEIK